ncbi:cytochrome c [Paraburkholderia sp.]|uniref:cytochrome c n=1 Tax=Paraburkholderia sp. TaxID=1926495 RepID=UPI002B4A6CB5|nr:cytochrome c [Paraburkholderia sp.]
MRYFKAWAAPMVAALCLASHLVLAQTNPAAGTAVAASANAAASSADDRMVMKGRYVATAADCAACHTASGGRPFAGGYPIQSPMGVIWSTNITPSKQYGIGNYTEAQFARAIREGVTPDGRHLYPAMPYPSYAKMTDGDVAALYRYFMAGVKPVDAASKETRLPFPFSVRSSMIMWNAIYAHSKPFTADPGKSAEYNRGDYLVNGLEHCSACHTGRTFLMGEDGSSPLGGGSLGAWYAPNISSDKAAGIGGWNEQDLYTYLSTGHVMGKAQAAGPMAEAVEHSLQYLSDSDLRAIVTYLKESKAVAGTEAPPRYDVGHASADESVLRGNAVENLDPGWKVYSGTCAACHGAHGEGTSSYPSLYHNTTTGAVRADNLIATILYGVHRTVDGKAIDMPGFGPGASFTERLSDQQVADVTNFVLTSFGRATPDVTAHTVATLRDGGPRSPLVSLAHAAIPVGGLIVIVLVVVLSRIRRTRKGQES